MASIDLTGKRAGRLIALSAAYSNKYGTYWNCLCDCGNHTVILHYTFGKGSNSCGCLRRDVISKIKKGNKNAVKHDMYGTPEYRTWRRIRNRCYNVSHHKYPDYGGRGIRVCDRWLESVINFYNDMGPRPSPKHSIERKDNDGDYSPENCCWATAKQQQYNRRCTLKLTAFGETKNLVEWLNDERCVVSLGLLRSRIKHGWDGELAMTAKRYAKHKHLQKMMTYGNA